VTTQVLVKERKRLEAEGHDVGRKPVSLDVTLAFTMEREKGVLEVSATCGNAKLENAAMKLTPSGR